MNLIHLLPNSDLIAIKDNQNELSYKNFISQIQKKINEFSTIQNRDVVWVECKNNSETLINFFALWQIGACVVPIDPLLGNQEKAYLDSQIPPQYLVYAREKNEIFQNIKLVTEPNLEILDANIVQLSSGSTGTPKIILISLEAILFRAHSNRDHLQLSEKDRTLCSVPLSHSHGIDCLALPTLMAGGFLMLTEPSTSFPYRILDWIESKEITFFSSLPQIYNFFNQLAEKKSYNLSSLRHAFCGSAALPAETALAFNQKYHLNLKQGYGLAEIGVICVNLKTDSSKYDSIGEPIPGIDWFLKEDGELCVKSKSLFSGYYKNRLATEERFENSFLLTEDLISIDQQGYFYVTGRKNDFININGNKVYPKEIENTLTYFSEIKECCVTSENDPLRGQSAVLHLVAGDQSLNQFEFEKKYLKKMSEKLEDFKIPRKFVWHQSLPKSPLGKILRSKL